MTYSQDSEETKEIQETLKKMKEDSDLWSNEDLVAQNPLYGEYVCPTSQLVDNETDPCWERLVMGQNFESMLLKVKITNETLTQLFNSTSLMVVPSTATTYCVEVAPDHDIFPLRSGVGNGVELLIDLETFDNADLEVTGDGLDLLVTSRTDYPLEKLNGFSVGPGSSVEIKIHPVLYSITAPALSRFAYTTRKCVEPLVDTAANQLDGTTGSYSLSNCLISAAVSKIYETFVTLHISSTIAICSLQVPWSDPSE